jgi:hypothetical protein
VSGLRAFLRDHRTLALLLIAAALVMKALVPAGFMVGTQAKTITVEICADTVGAQLSRTIAIPFAGKSDGGSGEHGKTDLPCAFGALAMATLGGADAVLLAAALAFVLALGFAVVRIAPAATPARLRPPLRAPPVHA